MIGDVAHLTTARLRLRPLRADDAAALMAGAGNYDVSRWLAVVPFPYGLGDARAFLSSPEAQPRQVWAICDRGGLVGLIALRGELGYWLARDAWGRGYAVEAGDAVVDAAFADPTRRVLRSSHMLGNDRSARVLEKLGFRPIGTERRHFRALGQAAETRVMEMTRPEWRARRRYRLRTARLRLRELRERDVPALRRIGGQPQVARQLFAVTAPWPAEAARHWLLAARFRGRPGFRAAVTRRGRLIGTVFMGPAPGGGPATCAWFIDPARWGRGYATEAAGAFLAETMDRFGIDTLWADHFADNPASGRVMAKLGFARSHAGTGISAARLEPAPVVVYRLDRTSLRVSR